MNGNNGIYEDALIAFDYQKMIRQCSRSQRWKAKGIGVQYDWVQKNEWLYWSDIQNFTKIKNSIKKDVYKKSNNDK